jgi:hypothetical protein
VISSVLYFDAPTFQNNSLTTTPFPSSPGSLQPAFSLRDLPSFSHLSISSLVKPSITLCFTRKRLNRRKRGLGWGNSLLIAFETERVGWSKRCVDSSLRFGMALGLEGPAAGCGYATTGEGDIGVSPIDFISVPAGYDSVTADILCLIQNPSRVFRRADGW